MDAFTADELARLRSQPQHFKTKLAVFRPYTSWSGLLDGDHDKGARQLTISTETGVAQDILAGTTLIVGNGINEDRVRIKSASGTFMEVAENNIEWGDDDELTALLYFEPFPVFNRLVNNDGVVSFYEDYDIPYTNENEIFTPVVNMGPAAFALDLDCIVSGSFVDLDMDASDSFVFDSAVSSYQWGILYGAADAFDAEFVGASDASSATIRFWDTGDYYISCTVTAANGKSYTGYRPVMVRCTTDGQAGSPYFDFNADTLEGSRDSGYWEASLSVFEDCDLDEFPRNVPVVIYGTVAYGQGGNRSTEQVPWHYTNTAHQRFVGWIREEAWIDEYMDKGRSVSFEAVGLCGVLDEIHNYPAWLRYSTSPTEWTDMTGLTVDRALYYYLMQRSNVLRLTDWHRTGDTKLMQYAEFPDGRMYSGMREFVAGTIFGDMVSDRNSALWTELDGQMLTDAARASIVTDVHAIDEADHMNEIIIPTTRDRPETSWVSVEGLYFDGVDNTPLIAYNDYVIDARGGDPETISGLVLPAAQSDLNTLAGRTFALRNNPFKSISYETQGVWPYDIAPQASLEYSGLQSGTFREETMTEADLLIRMISDKHTSDMGLTSELDLEVIIRDPGAIVGPNVPTADNGVEGIFPPDIEGMDPDDYATDWPDDYWDWPDYSIGIPEADPSDTGEAHVSSTTNNIAVFNEDNFIYLTGNFQDPDPTWTRVSMGLDGGDNFQRVEVDPASPLYNATGITVDVWVAAEDKLYKIEDVFGVSGGPFTTMLHTFNVSMSSVPSGLGEQQIHAKLDNGPNRRIVCCRYYHTHGTYQGTWATYSDDGGQTWTEVQVNNGYSNFSTPRGGPATWVSYKIDGRVYCACYASPSTSTIQIYESNDGGATWAHTGRFATVGSRQTYGDLTFIWDETLNPDDEQTWIYERNSSSFDFYYASGGGKVELTPFAGGEEPGVFRSGRWKIHSSPTDGQKLVASLRDLGGVAANQIYYSVDAGNTWFRYLEASGGVNADFIGIAGDNADTVFRIRLGFIYVSDTFYSDINNDSFDDKSGNLDDDFPGRGSFHWLVGG